MSKKFMILIQWCDAGQVTVEPQWTEALGGVLRTRSLQLPPCFAWPRLGRPRVYISTLFAMSTSTGTLLLLGLTLLLNFLEHLFDRERAGSEILPLQIHSFKGHSLKGWPWTRSSEFDLELSWACQVHRYVTSHSRLPGCTSAGKGMTSRILRIWTWHLRRMWASQAVSL